jgi:acyl carrier protein
MAASHSDIINQLTAYLKKRFLASGVEIQATDKFADIGIDSMTVVELVMFIEEEFGIEIPADQLTGDNLATLDSLSNCAIQNQTN